jgi:predicted AAA+ superfamily ATPase
MWCSLGNDSKPDTSNSLFQELVQRLLTIVPANRDVDWQQHHAGGWTRGRWVSQLVGYGETSSITLSDLLHIESQKQALQQNTEQFLAGLPANNALLWGARGSGKSSLVQALLADYANQGLRLVEVGKDVLSDLPTVIGQLRDQPFRFIVFCDDLSFEDDDSSYKSLKSVLEGTVLAQASNVLIYATSNRRHLLAEKASDNSDSKLVDGELHHGEAVEEKISLSDRFGLWLSFYPVRQQEYLDMVQHAVDRLVARVGAEKRSDPVFQPDHYRLEALRWALARGARNGRSAEHFARHWVGKNFLS